MRVTAEWYRSGIGRATGGLTKENKTFKYSRRGTQLSVLNNRSWLPDGVSEESRKDGWVVQYGMYNERIRKGALRGVFPKALDAIKAVEGQLELVRLMALDVSKITQERREF